MCVAAAGHTLAWAYRDPALARSGGFQTRVAYWEAVSDASQSLTQRDTTAPPAAPPVATRLVARLLVVVGVCLAVWTAYLAYDLPPNHVARNWDVAWAGFDTALVAMMFLVAYGVMRSRTWVQGAASATAALLVTDAWFDVLTASPGADRLESLLLSLTSELPLALLCGWIAVRADRLRRTSGGADGRRTEAER
jgi:hypothetical protein